jgi:ABC-type uncharacterized transport system substrate-binding protein
MPVVIATCPGMISSCFAKSLERPGGNVTGMEELPPASQAKRLTLLKTVLFVLTRCIALDPRA